MQLELFNEYFIFVQDSMKHMAFRSSPTGQLQFMTKRHIKEAMGLFLQAFLSSVGKNEMSFS